MPSLLLQRLQRLLCLHPCGSGSSQNYYYSNNNNNNHKTKNKKNKKTRKRKLAKSFFVLDQSTGRLVFHLELASRQRELVRLLYNLKHADAAMLDLYERVVVQLQLSIGLDEGGSSADNHSMVRVGVGVDDANPWAAKRKHKPLLSPNKQAILCQILQQVIQMVPNIQELVFQKRHDIQTIYSTGFVKVNHNGSSASAEDNEEDHNNNNNNDVNHGFRVEESSNHHIIDNFFGNNHTNNKHEEDHQDDDEDDDVYDQMVLPLPLVQAILRETAQLCVLHRLYFRNVCIPDYYMFYDNPPGLLYRNRTASLPRQPRLQYLELHHCWWIYDIYNNDETPIEPYWPLWEDHKHQHHARSLNNNNPDHHDESHQHANISSLQELVVSTNYHNRGLQEIQIQSYLEEVSHGHPSPSSSMRGSISMSGCQCTNLKVLNLQGYCLDAVDLLTLMRTLLQHATACTKTNTTKSTATTSLLLGTTPRTCCQLEQLSCRGYLYGTQCRTMFCKLLEAHPTLNHVDLTVMDSDMLAESTSSSSTVVTAGGAANNNTMDEEDRNNQLVWIDFLAHAIPNALQTNALIHNDSTAPTGRMRYQKLVLRQHPAPKHWIKVPLAVQLAWLNLVTMTSNNDNETHSNRSSRNEDLFGLEAFGIAGQCVRYADSALQRILQYRLGLNRLHRVLHQCLQQQQQQQQQSNGDDRGGRGGGDPNHRPTNEDDSAMLSKEAFVTVVLADISDNVPLLFYLLQRNPALICN